MNKRQHHAVWAAALTLALHAGALWVAGMRWGDSLPTKPARTQAVLVQMLPDLTDKVRTPPATSPPEPEPQVVTAPSVLSAPAPTSEQRVLASMAAPAAPSAEEWAFAARYTLKNSKAYRHTWGQQVRSMMGTAVEGPDQGMVRFRIEIAPDGQLHRLQTLWSTSAVAERLARQAIEQLPRLPPTPTGQPLVFEKTIAFSAFAHEDPPIYKDDCQPDPPAFSNPFAWDGRSPLSRAGPARPAPPDPRELQECMKQLPQDSIEAESARDRRLLEQWGSVRPGR